MVINIIATITFGIVALLILYMISYISHIFWDTLQYWSIYILFGKYKSKEEKEHGRKLWIYQLKNAPWLAIGLPHKPKFLNRKKKPKQ